MVGALPRRQGGDGSFLNYKWIKALEKQAILAVNLHSLVRYAERENH